MKKQIQKLGTLSLNIENYEIDFKFNFEDILTKLGIATRDKNNMTICSCYILFYNCTFSKNAYFQYVILNKNVSFYECKFDESVDFRNCTFNEIAIFNDITFNQNVNFSYTDFNKVVDFTRVIFTKNVVFGKIEFSGYTLFESVEFKTFENPEDENNKRIFKNVNFKIITCCNSYMRNIIFEKCNFEELNVYKVGVDINLFLYSTEFNKVEFNHCTFNKLLLGKSIIRDCLFNKSKIIEEADFHTHLCPADINKVLETRTIIDNTKFNKVHFKQSADFKDSSIESSEWFAIKFDKDADFKRVDFGNKVKFHHIYFGDIGAFWNIKGKYIQFDSIHLVEKSNIYFGHINQIESKNENNETIWETIEYYKKSKLDFTNTMIKGIVNFNTGNNIEKIDFKGSQVNDNLSIELCQEKCANWETASILKNEALKHSNIIESLKYQSLEKDSYLKELWDEKNIRECAILGLAKIVNNHGQDWLLALMFTIWVWLFSYTVFITPNNFF